MNKCPYWVKSTSRQPMHHINNIMNLSPTFISKCHRSVLVKKKKVDCHFTKYTPFSQTSTPNLNTCGIEVFPHFLIILLSRWRKAYLKQQMLGKLVANKQSTWFIYHYEGKIDIVRPSLNYTKTSGCMLNQIPQKSTCKFWLLYIGLLRKMGNQKQNYWCEVLLRHRHNWNGV